MRIRILFVLALALSAAVVAAPTAADDTKKPPAPGVSTAPAHVDPGAPSKPAALLPDLHVQVICFGHRGYPEACGPQGSTVVLTKSGLQVGDRCQMDVWTGVENHGASIAKNVMARMTSEGDVLNDGPLPSLNPNRGTYMGFLTAKLRPGLHEIRLEIDPDHKISEVTRDNNVVTLRYDLKACSPKKKIGGTP